MKTSMRALLALAFVVNLSGCGDSSLYLHPNQCGTDGGCPPGLECAETPQGRFCVYLPDEDGGVPFPVEDGGAAGEAYLVLSKEVLDFGNPMLGIPTVRDLLVSNSGNEDLLIYSLSILEDDLTDEFTLGTLVETPIRIAPAGSAALSVRLLPADAELDHGYLLMATNDASATTSLGVY